MDHYPSCGKPYGPSEDLGGFGPTGQAKRTDDQGAVRADLSADPAAALREFGGLVSAHKSGTLQSEESLRLPSEGGPKARLGHNE